jgi:CRISPR system Cascade subunit CasD
MQTLLLRFDAPLMSFGGPSVDERGITQDHPPLSLVTGLIGNALGYDHRDTAHLQRLQARLCIAARRDRRGQRMTDFHTAFLGQQALVGTGWTTRGRVEARSGGSAREATHIRMREYLADAVYTLALAVDPADEPPTLDEIAAALDSPQRPLFLGRKPCLPATPLVLGQIEANSLRDALGRAPGLDRVRVDGDGNSFDSWWPEADDPDGGAFAIPVTDERDWVNQIHGGQRFVVHGTIRLREVSNAD